MNTNNDTKLPGKTLRISDKLKKFDVNFQNSALNALKNSVANTSGLKKNLKKDFQEKKSSNDLNQEEYRLRMAAIESRVKSRNLNQLSTENNLKSEEKKDMEIECLFNLQNNEPEKKIIKEDKDFCLFQEITKKDKITKEDEMEAFLANQAIQLKKVDQVKNKDLDMNNLDDYLDSLVLANEKVLKDNNKLDDSKKSQFFAKRNNTKDLNENDLPGSQVKQQYFSGINHNAIIKKRNEIERIEKAIKLKEEESRSKNIKSSLFHQDQKKKSMNFRASVLNVIDENNEDLLFKDKFGGKSLNRKKLKNKNDSSQKFVPKEILVQSENNLKELANSINLKAGDLIKVLSKIDKKAKYKENSILDQEITELVLLEIGHIPIIDSFLNVEKLIVKVELKNFSRKAPVVTIMGHVDHGKTSLLDAMKRRFKANSTNITESESGGITQHIGAYQIISESGKSISFIDTPGHEAFTAIRARGSMVTDIVILVVAADDGIMPQTIEAIKHAQSAKVPIIVAINKIDKPDSNIQGILNQLIQYDIITEENGGDTISVPISAKTGQNLEKLEEVILLVAEMINLEADETVSAIGTIIEAKINNTKGPCATVLVQQGTLRTGDTLITNDRFCKVRSMFDENSLNLNEVGPARAAEIFGFDEVPSVGEKFIVLENEKVAKNFLSQIISDSNRKKLIDEQKKIADESISSISQTGSSKMKSIFDLFKSNLRSNTSNNLEDQIQELHFIVKADVSGTIDAVKYSLEKLNNENGKIKITIIYSSTGSVTESDIMLAKSSSAMICAFNVGAQANIRNLIEKEGLSFKTYTIIYQLIDDIKSIIENKLKPKKIEKIIGKALVKKIFDISGIGLIAGCEVQGGSVIIKGGFVRLKRAENIIAEEILIRQLKRGKENVREVTSGLECGIALQDYDDLLKGDILEIYQIIDNI